MLNINNIKVEKKTSGNTLLDAMHEETSMGLTDNGAPTYTRTASPLLDFYAQAGAMRKSPEKALELFKKAFSEDNLLAIRILFYLRDVRGGQGERELFRICFQWIGETRPDILKKIIKYVPEYGRWDDLFFDNEDCFEFLKEAIFEDAKSEKPSLLAKWLPTINASSANTVAKAKIFAKKFGLEAISYRRIIRLIRKKLAVVEEKMSARKWTEIKYEAVPSQAGRIYRNAFKKHDEEGYGKYLESVEKGEKKINAGTLYPYQLYKDAMHDYSKTIEELWKALPNYGGNKNALVVADVSGSMSGDPMSVSVSLALYFAERNKGAFKDHFITFSRNPQLQKIMGNNLQEKMNSINRSNWDMNTDLIKVFSMILTTAKKNNISQEEMPETIYIISDMEFDDCVNCGKTNFQTMQEMYDEANYKLPNVVFWNVNASGNNLPVRENELGVAMVSGYSPVIFKIAVENKTPIQVMMDTINAERYLPIEI